MKRFLAVMLAVFMLIPTLVACNASSGNNDTSAAPNTTDAPSVSDSSADTPGETPEATPEETPAETPEDTTPEEEPEEASTIALTTNKSANFRVVYDKSDSEVKVLAQDLCVKLLVARIKNLGTAYDDESVEYDENTIEILIGDTNRPETEKAKKRVGYNDFGIVVVGNKLAICAHNMDALTDAVEYFTTNYIEGKDVENLSISTETDYVSSRYYPNAKTEGIFGAKYKDYTIVVPADHTYTEYRFAQRIQTMIGNKVGAVVPIVDDSTSPVEREILVGKTNRTTGSVGDFEYLMKVNGKKLELISDSFYGYDYLYNYCNTDMLYEVRRAEQGDAEITRSSYISNLAADRSSNFAEKQGDIRIAYHNVCGFGISSAPGGGNMPDLRNPMIAEYYADYGVDILCLEEITPSMRASSNVVDFMAKYGYAECPSEIMSFKVPANCDYAVGNSYSLKTTTPILYNTNTLICLESGAKNYCQELSADSGIYFQWDKCMSYAVFEVKATGEKFVVINVHFDSFENKAGDGMPRLKAKRETAFVIGVANELAEKYGCPALIGGDMNVTVGDPNFTTNSQYINAGYTDVHGIAQEAESERGHFKTNPEYNACLGGGFFTGEGQVGYGSYDQSVDHIYVNSQGKNEIIFHFFDVLNDSSANSFGDHCGMLVDFSFKD